MSGLATKKVEQTNLSDFVAQPKAIDRHLSRRCGHNRFRTNVLATNAHKTHHIG